MIGRNLNGKILAEKRIEWRVFTICGRKILSKVQMTDLEGDREPEAVPALSLHMTNNADVQELEGVTPRAEVDTTKSGRRRLKPPPQAGKAHTIGTFVGVFVPCFVNIVNIVYWARLPYVVGEAGGFATIAGLVVSFVLVLVTVLNLSAFSTNGEMESGGAYYLVSRTIGPEAGSGCGISLALASIAGAATSHIGLAEQIVMFYQPRALCGRQIWDVRVFSMLMCLPIGWLARFGFPIRVVMFFRDLGRYCRVLPGSRVSVSD